MLPYAPCAAIWIVTTTLDILASRVSPPPFPTPSPTPLLPSQDQDPGETVHILDVDLSDIVRVTIQPAAAGGAALQTAQVELVPQQRRSGTQGGADGMVSPHR